MSETSRIYGAGLVLSSKDIRETLEILDNHEGDDIPKEVLIWQPFENRSLDDIMEMIDDNERTFDDFLKEVNHREMLEEKGYCLETIWQIADVQGRFKCDDKTARAIMNETLGNEAVMTQIWESMEIIAEDKFNLKTI